MYPPTDNSPITHDGDVSAHILLVDDDPMLAKLVAFLLGNAGYAVATLADPRRVCPFLDQHVVDLALLDVALPYQDGFGLAADIRRAHPDLPLIFLSARGMVTDKVMGFGHGADDYLSKPFEPTELVARIRAVLRRCRGTQADRCNGVVTVGDVTLELGELRFRVPGRPPASLTVTEMKLLEHLMRHANRIVTNEQLMERLWGVADAGLLNRVAVCVRRLRGKIEPDPEEPMYLQTVRGVGYVFRDQTRRAA